jgi:hypothetical protein
MTGGYNTGSGFQALASNTTAGENTAIGLEALMLNTTGGQNTAVGSFSLVTNTVGIQNAAFGYEALQNGTTGSFNTGVGATAGYSLGTGSYNTLLGFNTIPGAGNLNNATAVGANAEVDVSNALVLGGINGVNGATADTLVGVGITAPTYKLHVGTINKGLRIEGPSKGGSTAVAVSVGGNGDVGVDAPGTVNGRFVVKDGGNVGIGTATPDALLSVNGSADKSGGGSWGTFSDRRLKTLGGSYSSGLNQILKIHPVRYRYKADNAMGIRDHDEHVGLVAQEVQKVIPEAVTENSRGFLLVNNDPIIWAMLNAIKEQQAVIHKQQQQIARLNSRVRAIQASLSTSSHFGSEVRTAKAQLPAMQQ